MKLLFAICMFVASASVWAGEPAAATQAPAAVRGEVLEVKDVSSYTYLRLKTKDGETWAAVSMAPVKKGDQVTIENPMVVNNFESKSLKKTFPTIVFGTLGGAAGHAAMSAMPAGHAQAAEAPDVHVAKASGANAHTVAEIATKAAELKDKPVAVRGKVVKFNSQIMGKNWVHLHDGTGSAADGSNDLVVTTTAEAKVGDILTAKGIVRADKDFGSGYVYKVLVEEATLSQ